MKKTVILLSALIALATACDSRPDAAADGEGSRHHHEPPHGGTAVVLGDEEYHLEFVLDAATGRMQVYLLSAHMENFVRISAESFAVTARLGEREATLIFKAVANNATGETVGDTSLFEAQADWLSTNKSFDAVLKEITIKGKRYENVAFNFPNGN
jgi:hypothetical protein